MSAPRGRVALLLVLACSCFCCALPPVRGQSTGCLWHSCQFDEELSTVLPTCRAASEEEEGLPRVKCFYHRCLKAEHQHLLVSFGPPSAAGSPGTQKTLDAFRAVWEQMDSDGLELAALDLESNATSIAKVAGKDLALMPSGEAQNFAVFDDIGGYWKEFSLYLYSAELKAVVLPRLLLGKHDTRQPDPRSSSEWVLLRQDTTIGQGPKAANQLFDDVAAVEGPLTWAPDKAALRSLCGACGGGCGSPPPEDGPVTKVAKVISKFIVSVLVFCFLVAVCYHLCCRKWVLARRAAREQEARERWDAMSPEEQAEVQRKLDRELAAMQQAAFQQEQASQRQRAEASARQSLQMEEARRESLARTEYARRMGW